MREKILGVIAVILIIVVVIIMAILFCDFISRKISAKRRNKTAVSFFETLNLVGLPIITVNNNGHKLNFLLDTGSNTSYINEGCIDMLDYKKTDEKGKIVGMNGTVSAGEFIEMNISYRNNSFEETFLTANLNDLFAKIRANKRIELHGLIGVSFFDRYRYILDFKEYAAYQW